jgi:hypothetical protein
MRRASAHRNILVCLVDIANEPRFCSFALIRSVRRGRIQNVAAFSCAKAIAKLENSSVLLTGYTCYENHQYLVSQEICLHRYLILDWATLLTILFPTAKFNILGIK